ncbi:purine-binding chemotaxis protein CheW [Anaerosolibacter carboniphilus]|uniref:Chemotaxis protein CheW n=1 Tax=Anaerosolibacter carboniphilus TaxID=1417629 RepID=A0A841KPD8_9FIRM|nr:chemotaxis protein CheW [Anaerosolibacter carboniphilus]MBB6215644.1 purine-binding chemotaxis protein CheW [Anaerosolibacter carboniphilus]
MSERQYVIFKLGNEEYGVDIMNVKEISEYKQSVKVPNTPKFVDGIINLRGDITPIINLKKRFNLDGVSVDSDTRIIVINIKSRQVGFVVDEASQVIRLSEEDIEPAPELVAGIDKKYITGVGKLKDRIVLLLNLEEVLSEDEKEKIQNIQ